MTEKPPETEGQKTPKDPEEIRNLIAKSVHDKIKSEFKHHDNHYANEDTFVNHSDKFMK